MLPSMLVRLPSVHPKRLRLAVWRPSVPSPVKSTGSGGGWCGLPSRDFLAHGSSPSFVFFFPVHFSNLPRSSKSATPQTTPSAWIPSGSRNIVFGWTAHPIASLSSTRAARISAARLIGKPAKTSSSAPATAAATTAKGSTLKGPRRAPWIARTWSWRQTAKLSWTPPGSINGPRDNPATSAIRDRICRCNWERRESVPRAGRNSNSSSRYRTGEQTMPEEKTPNGKNGKSAGLVERLKAGVKEDLESLKTELPAKAKEQVEILKKPTKTQVYTSIFRHKHDDTPRNRALGVLSNVFLHLHPAKINRDAVRYSYTWGMGGITFYLFIVLTLTGVLLMFYYHPSKVQAFRDVLYLEHDVPFGKLLRNMHRWAAHLMVIAVELHMFRVFLTGSYKKPREFNWTVGVILLVLTLLLSFTGYLLPDDQLGFWAVTVGTNMARATPLLGHEGPFGAQMGMTPYNDVRFGLLGGSIVDANALLRSYIWHCIAIPIIAKPRRFDRDGRRKCTSGRSCCAWNSSPRSSSPLSSWCGPSR